MKDDFDKDRALNAVASILMGHFRYLHCDGSCRFSAITPERSEELYHYYGCDDCHPAMLGWELSENSAYGIAREIINKIVEC